MDFPSTFIECLSIARESKRRGSWEDFEWIDRRGSMDETRPPRVRDRRRSSGLGALMTISRDEKRLDDNQDATRRDPTDLLHALQILRTPTSARQHTIKHAATPSFGLMSNSSHWRSTLFLVSFFLFLSFSPKFYRFEPPWWIWKIPGLSLSRICSAIILFRRICMSRFFLPINLHTASAPSKFLLPFSNVQTTCTSVKFNNF